MFWNALQIERRLADKFEADREKLEMKHADVVRWRLTLEPKSL